MQLGERGDYFYIVVKGTMVVMTMLAANWRSEWKASISEKRLCSLTNPLSRCNADCELARIDEKTFVRLVELSELELP